MGGTSTDVSLSTGEIPRRFAAEIDGVRLQTPLVDITTIAAGGGSVLRFADGRLQVGPASAGADPGPACYRRNGPATITDCNVVLGRIPPDRFPHVFGPAGDQPIDPAASRARLAELAAAARDEAGLEYSVEALAEAFLQVACARMANAIRELALHHGEDPARFGLLSFGGAAGQHACAVAGAARRRRSAAASARGRAVRVWHRADRSSRDSPTHGRSRARCVGARGRPAGAGARSQTDARDDLLRQGVDASRVEVRASAHVRLAGSDTTLELPWQPADALRVAFFEAHRQLYGFADEAAALVIGSVMAEAIERVAAAAPDLVSPARRRCMPMAAVPPACERRGMDRGGCAHGAGRRAPRSRAGRPAARSLAALRRRRDELDRSRLGGPRRTGRPADPAVGSRPLDA